MPLESNPGKNLTIDVDGKTYERIPLKTHTIVASDRIEEVVQKYVVPHLQEGDVIFMSERSVAITQGRAIPIKDVHPGWLARFLVKFVHKSPYGIGLGIPETMQLAIQEVGVARILLGTFVAALTKPFGIKGMFYRICGEQAAAIDGPCSYTLPPYNEYATLAPLNADRVAHELGEKISHDVVIIDANDLGVAVLGRSSDTISKAWSEAVFRDNPLGQTDERTPLCIVRQR